MSKRKVAVDDFLDRGDLSEAVTALSNEFADWESHDGQGTRQLWSVLGAVYELGEKIELNALAKSDLIEQVKSDANVQSSNNWDPAKKGAYELLLVRLLSLKEETKAKKSQWLSAIRAAKKAKVESSKASFVEFLATVGGVDKARKLYARSAKPKHTFEELAQWARTQINWATPTIQTPLFRDQEV